MSSLFGSWYFLTGRADTLGHFADDSPGSRFVEHDQPFPGNYLQTDDLFLLKSSFLSKFILRLRVVLYDAPPPFFYHGKKEIVSNTNALFFMNPWDLVKAVIYENLCNHLSWELLNFFVDCLLINLIIIIL